MANAALTAAFFSSKPRNGVVQTLKGLWILPSTSDKEHQYASVLCLLSDGTFVAASSRHLCLGCYASGQAFQNLCNCLPEF